MTTPMTSDWSDVAAWNFHKRAGLLQAKRPNTNLREFVLCGKKYYSANQRKATEVRQRKAIVEDCLIDLNQINAHFRTITRQNK